MADPDCPPFVPLRGNDLQPGAEFASWPEQGAWTWNDYCRLPDDGQRYEIIRGVLYVSPAPRVVHQLVTTRVAHFLSGFVIEHRLGVVLTSPLDVLLPGIANPVQPDVVFLKQDNLPDLETAKNFQGVPDLVAEVLSAGTQRIELEVKLKAYEQAGVSEYWIVDPRDRSVLLYHLAGRRGYREPVRFGAGETIRSNVLGGFELEVSELFP